MSEKTLVAVDGSQHMQQTLKKAIANTREAGAELIILHVITPHELTQEELDFAEKKCGEKFMHLVRGDFLPAFQIEDEAERKYIGDYVNARSIFPRVYGEEILRQAKKTATEQGIENIRTIMKEGDVAGVILDTAREENVDMIVIGRHGHNRIAEFFLGSIAQKVIQHANCSVLAVE